jgi:hypothetical protein
MYPTAETSRSAAMPQGRYVPIGVPGPAGEPAWGELPANCCATDALPQSAQNRDPTGSTALHTAHSPTASLRPHCSQNVPFVRAPHEHSIPRPLPCAIRCTGRCGDPPQAGQNNCARSLLVKLNPYMLGKNRKKSVRALPARLHLDRTSPRASALRGSESLQPSLCHQLAVPLRFRPGQIEDFPLQAVWLPDGIHRQCHKKPNQRFRSKT